MSSKKDEKFKKFEGTNKGQDNQKEWQPSEFVDQQSYASVVKYGRSNVYTKEMEQHDLEVARQEMKEYIEKEMKKFKEVKLRNWMEAMEKERKRKKEN